MLVWLGGCCGGGVRKLSGETGKVQKGLNSNILQKYMVRGGGGCQSIYMEMKFILQKSIGAVNKFNYSDLILYCEASYRTYNAPHPHPKFIKMS